MLYMIFLLKSALHAGSRKPCSKCPCTVINVLISNSAEPLQLELRRQAVLFLHRHLNGTWSRELLLTSGVRGGSSPQNIQEPNCDHPQ